MAYDYQKIASLLTSTFPESSMHEFRGECTISVPSSSLRKVLECCHTQGMDFLIDICSIDHFEEQPRFEIVYELAKVDDSVHIRIKSRIEESEAVLSVCDLWATANWHEREIYDMMGIIFDKHPDLRRILMWEGYPYHPLRKDFPLAGKPTDMPEVAFSAQAPMEGGPFVTTSGKTRAQREPRSRG